MRLSYFAGLAVVERDLGSGPIDEQLFAGAMLLPHDPILMAPPLIVMPPKAGVGIGVVGMCLPVFLP
jgi:hypothetical protein